MSTKKAHEVTFSYLRAWSTKIEKNKGVWYFDIARQETRFATEKKRFSFATKRYLYMPEIDGQRNQAAENWLAEAEGAFASFCKRIIGEDFMTPLSVKDLTKVIFSLVSLGYRSGLEIGVITDEILENQKLREHLGVTSAHTSAVENMVNVISRQARLYLSGSIQVLFRLDQPLLVCERPLIDMPEFAILPLTPNAMLKMEPRSVSSTPNSLTWVEAPSGAGGLCDSLNSLTIDHARKWVVAQSRDFLESIRHELTRDKVAARAKKDCVVFTPPAEKGGLSWWELTGS